MHKLTMLAIVLVSPVVLAGPPPEIASMIKSMGGAWRCEGTTGDAKLAGTLKLTPDLDGWWARDAFDGTVGTGKTATRFKFQRFTTFDAASKKWRVVLVDDLGTMMIGESDGMKDMKMETVLDVSGPGGKGQFQDHVDASDQRKGVHLWGEESHDGKTWTKIYDMVCRR